MLFQMPPNMWEIVNSMEEKEEEEHEQEIKFQ